MVDVRGDVWSKRLPNAIYHYFFSEVKFLKKVKLIPIFLTMWNSLIKFGRGFVDVLTLKKSYTSIFGKTYLVKEVSGIRIESLNKVETNLQQEEHS